MLTIKNVRWNFRKFTNHNMLIRILHNRLQNLKLKTRINMLPDIENGIIFNDVESNMTFMSAVDNKINMRTSDPRINKLGRNYLLSKRPTQKQYNGFFEVIHNTLDELGLNADVELVATKTNRRFVIRKDKENFKLYPHIKSFPIE